MNKLTPFQRFAQEKGVFVKGKKDPQIAIELSRKLSGMLVTYAVASRQGGKRMDIAVDIGGRWMHTEFAVAPCTESVALAYQTAKENFARIRALTREDAA